MDIRVPLSSRARARQLVGAIAREFKRERNLDLEPGVVVNPIRVRRSDVEYEIQVVPVRRRYP